MGFLVSHGHFHFETIGNTDFQVTALGRGLWVSKGVHVHNIDGKFLGAWPHGTFLTILAFVKVAVHNSSNIPYPKKAASSHGKFRLKFFSHVYNNIYVLHKFEKILRMYLHEKWHNSDQTQRKTQLYLGDTLSYSEKAWNQTIE